VGIQEGYEISKGEIGAPVRNASISGNTLETLHKVSGVGHLLDLDDGKGQLLLSAMADLILELARWLSVAV
jgi:predicted Zn-dependent protease